jgi:hypothetical protein
MPADQTFANATEFAAELRRHRIERDRRVNTIKSDGRKRISLTRAERANVLLKAGARCHICGGLIAGNKWEADHVFAHSSGGCHSVDNYLPAHSLCNNYRWHYGAEEFQWILKLGVWLRTQIETETPAGRAAGDQFAALKRRRATRRRPSAKLGDGRARRRGVRVG